jgi:FkbH-like protein
MNHSTRREKIDQLIASNAANHASILLHKLWRQEAGPSAAAFVVSRYERLLGSLPMTASRLFILRSFTLEPVVPLLRAAGFVNGIDLIVEVGGFNTYVQELLDPNSRLYNFVPDVAILAVQTRDVVPVLWEGYTSLSSEELEEVIQGVISDYRNWIEAFRRHSKASLILHTLEAPPLPSQGILDSQSTISQIAALQEINDGLRGLASGRPGVSVLDYDGLICRYGRMRWYDDRKWLSMRLPIAAENLVNVANEWLRFIHPIVGRTCKALVTDLDNTLWGGVVGEDGIDRIQLGAEGPGAAFLELQRVMLDLYHRGILLAICSKNNWSDAMEALEKHPGMILKPTHFAALRINWSDKAENLREIAAELNIGIDSLAFLDDNPVERARIRAAMPEVTVIQLPRDPIEYARALRQTPVFERLTLSEEDRERGRYYAEQRQRAELEHSSCSLENFYRSLKQKLEIALAGPGTLSRVAQLTQKTNQFNVTTRRYSEQQIAEMISRTDFKVYTVRVQDRFGDNGLVGVVIIRESSNIHEIDTFLMSCRVVARTIETAILSFVVEQSRKEGCRTLQGWFLPTSKNELAKEFYPVHHFQPSTQNGTGILWSLDISDARISCPEWIELVSEPTTSDVTAV